MAVTPVYTESSALVRQMEVGWCQGKITPLQVKRRNCIFADEKNVENAEIAAFKTYSQENCLLECRAKTLLKTCGCLPYYYPRCF